MEILKVKNLNKTYGKNQNKVKALNEISFSVDEGQFVAIVGKSGSGKSTLMHVIGGVDSFDSGEVYIDEKNIKKFNEDELIIFRRQNIGIVYQFYNLIPVLTVKENIILPAILNNKTVSDDCLEELLKSLGLTNKENMLPSDLSGGQMQRTAIGRALINNPKLILADEPTGNLDSKMANNIMKKLKYYNKRYKQTIIMVTHDETLARQTDRIITMHDGKIIKDEILACQKKSK